MQAAQCGLLINHIPRLPPFLLFGLQFNTLSSVAWKCGQL